MGKVSTAKPKTGGAVYYAELSDNPTIPTSTSAVLTGFTNLGFVSEDGLTNSNKLDVENIKEWGGSDVLVVQKGKEDSFQFTLIDSLDENVLKLVHGASNVTGTISGNGAAIAVGNDEQTAKCFVFDIIMTGNIAKRIVIPNATISEIGDVVYKPDEAVGYEITLSALLDAYDNTHYEYIKAPAAASASAEATDET